MQLLSFLTLAGVAVASLSQGSKRSASFNELTGIMERQLRICDRVPVGPNFCERSCGTGFVSCVNESTCYNPTIGDVCCSDGTSCEAGTYCTDTTCCPDGMSLEECGASQELDTIAPPGPEPSTSAPPDTAVPEPTVTDSPPDTTPPASTPPVLTPTPSSKPNATGAPPMVDGSGSSQTVNVLALLGSLAVIFVALN